jgi:ABC-type phosphate/phosphonate transport system substrate-binding protein
MQVHRRVRLLAFVVTSVMVCAGAAKLVAQEKPYKVALVESVFSGQNRAKVVEQIRPFAEIIERDTNTKANFDVVSFAEAEKGFASGEIQLIILTGLEYGWIHTRYDQGKALVIASIDPGATKTVIIANQKDSARSLNDLTGKKLAVPDRVPFLSEFYLQRTLGKKLDEAFKVVRMDNVDDTIEDVVEGKSAGGLITGSNLDTYKDRKPGRFRRLQIVHQSPEFPPATVMYNAKSADQDLLNRFERALLRAADNPEGQRVLTLYKLKGFEKLPADFDRRVAEIVKQFPEKNEK